LIISLKVAKKNRIVQLSIDPCICNWARLSIVSPVPTPPFALIVSLLKPPTTHASRILQQRSYLKRCKPKLQANIPLAKQA
jgi:hypothetical protein